MPFEANQGEHAFRALGLDPAARLERPGRDLYPLTQTGFQPWGSNAMLHRRETLLGMGGQARSREHAIATGEARVKVLRSDESWVGLTYRSDRERASEHISQLRRRGIYPPHLW